MSILLVPEPDHYDGDDDKDDGEDDEGDEAHHRDRSHVQPRIVSVSDMRGIHTEFIRGCRDWGR